MLTSCVSAWRFFRLALALVSLALPLSPLTSGAQLYQGRELVKAELVANTTAITPGEPFKVGLLLRMAPGWHTYWKFPGDAGIPTEIKWNLPPGWAAGEIQWPTPLRLVEPGDIEIYGYHDEVLLCRRSRHLRLFPTRPSRLLPMPTGWSAKKSAFPAGRRFGWSFHLVGLQHRQTRSYSRESSARCRSPGPLRPRKRIGRAPDRASC